MHRRLRGGARRGAGIAALIATLGSEIEFFLRAAQLLLELLIAELQLLDLAGEHAHLVLDLVEAHHDIGGRHLRGAQGSQGRSASAIRAADVTVRDMGITATHTGKAALS